ncbi:MAG: TonB-dependent receptor [Elusimicrobiota bacterium]
MKKLLGILFVFVGMGTLVAQETTVFIGLRKEVPVEKTATNITVISEEEIKTSDAKTVGEILENKTGITEVSKYGTLGATSDLRIRSGGGTSKQVLVMVDGRPVNNISLGSANLTEISTENIEKIEVLRGPSSALYGANALGGVINIITKKATTPKPKTEIGLNYGTFNTQNYNFNFSVMPGKADIFLSGSKNLCKGFRENSDYDSTNLSAKIGYDFEKYGEFCLNNGVLNSELGVPGSNATPIEKFDNDKERKASSPNATQKDKKFYNQLEHKIKSKETTIITKFYQDYHERNYKNPEWSTDTVNKPQSFGFDTQAETVYNIVFGFEKRFEKYKKLDNKVETIDKKRENFATFIQKIFEFNKLSLTPGIRYDYNSVYKETTNPRLVAVYQLADSIKLSATVGKAFRAPTFDDLYWPDEGWAKGNPNLKPEKSVGCDFGVEHRLRDILVSKITMFYSDVKDFIQWDPDKNFVWTPLNADVFSKGIELTLENSSIKNLTQNLNYTFLESKGKLSEDVSNIPDDWYYKTLQYTPKHRLNYCLNYSAPAEIKTKLGVEYTHKQEWKDWKYKGGTEHKLPGYTLVNLRLSKKILQAEVYFSCENIFDKRYVSRENYPLPGRTFSGGINLYLWD